MSKIIGIDLGTTNSVVAVMEGNTPKVLTNAQGSRLTPSVVAITDKGDRLVGQIARNQQVTNPENTVFSIKRFMGRRHNEVSSEEKIVPYKVIGGPEELVRVECRGKDYAPPQISAMILQDLKKTAEDYLGEKVERAVITVPAYFNDSQRKATKEAGEIAGLTVERIINEPTAAALAYGLDKKKEERIAVFDLGGGTFDISILEIDPEIGTFEVKSTSGDGHLGGDDYDEELINFISEEFRKKEGIDLRQDPMAMQRLKESCEKAKCELSTSLETTINLPFITASSAGPKHMQQTITRSKFEQLTEHLTERCRGPVMEAMKAAKFSPSDIDEVVLVGGSTRMPAVQALAKDIFNKEPNRSINPDEVVAIGAALQGAVLAGDLKEMLLLDVTPADPRRRDPGRQDDPAHSGQHHHPDLEDRDLLHRSRRPDRGHHPRAPGQQADGRPQPHPRPVQPHRHRRSPAGNAADRRDLRHRRQRHPQGQRQGQSHRQGAVHPHRGQFRPVRRRSREDEEGSRRARR